MTDDEMLDLIGHAVELDGGLDSIGPYLHYEAGSHKATLDGQFTADELEAIARWIRHHALTGGAE